MLYFANPSTAAIRQQMVSGRLACIITPKQGNRRPSGSAWCVDNGLGPDKHGNIGAGYPGHLGYLGMLQDLWWAEGSDPYDPGTSDACFAVAPDVLGDAAATLKISGQMLGWIRQIGFPAALVGQNGLEHLPVPWGDLDVFFLGGSAECLPCGYVRPPADARTVTACPYCSRSLTEWKLGAAARELTAQAKARGKWVHMGRVNSLKRLRYAAAIGCDSADGTMLTRAPDLHLPTVLGWDRAVNDQGALFDVGATA